MSGLIPSAIAAGSVLIAAYYGTNKALGAHPFWDTQVALIGVPIGLILAFALRALKWRWSTRLLTFLVLLTIAGTAAHQGRLEFAASYAENKLAGQLWYFGWIASMSFATATLAAIMTPGQNRQR
ncbi:MAG: hypothetical protein ABJF50_07840 [Paracoccaceae bacterium]